jgi:hypothetical protein
MAKKKTPILGCFIILVIAIAAAAQLFKAQPIIGIVATLAFASIGLVFTGLVLWFSKSKCCEVCGNVIERKSHRWAIDGKEKTVCAPIVIRHWRVSGVARPFVSSN